MNGQDQIISARMKELVVLYVEDEPMLREETASFLKRRFKKVLLASNGLEALESLDAYHVDLVITDLLMPKLDGMKLTEEIRNRFTEMPVIITTAINDINIMQESIVLGIDRYLIKPFDITALCDALEAVVLKRAVKMNPAIRMHDADKRKEMIAFESDLAKILKETSGKGPEMVSISVNANLSEIVIKGGRSRIEKTILNNPDNVRIVDFLRETYYRQLEQEILKLFKSHFDCHAVLQQTICDSRKDMDKLKWIID